MGFNISGLAINKNYENDFDQLQKELGWNLEKQSEIDFEKASSNWMEDGICNVYFTENGTLMFIGMDMCRDSFPLKNDNSLSFALSETSMVFNINYCEKGIEKRSIMEVNDERIIDEGEKLEVEIKSEDTSEIIWNQIEKVIGKRFWDIEPEEKAVMYTFNKEKVEPVVVESQQMNSFTASKIYNNKTEYNYKGNVKEIFIQSYSNSGTLEQPELGKKLSSSKIIFIDKNGKIESIQIFNEDEIGLIIKFENDGKSICTEIMYSGEDGSIQRTTSYTHIKDDQFEFIVLDAGKREAQKGISVVHQDKTIKESYNYYESILYNTDFKYDNNDRLVHQLRIREKNELIYNISYKYLESDGFNNWTKRIIIHRNENDAVTFNSIEVCEYKYYETNEC